MQLILASASSSRKAMLEAADVPFSARASKIDESRFKIEGVEPSRIALQLAEAKALDISREFADAWVIGSDSVVAVDGRRFDKPEGRDDAARHLRIFSGKTLELTSAVALARDGKVEWTHQDKARLSVRQLSESFIQRYLDKEWPEVGYCVGVFRIEARGVHLFDAMEGNHFTVLGMPLIPLLGALRQRGLIPA